MKNFITKAVMAVCGIVLGAAMFLMTSTSSFADTAASYIGKTAVEAHAIFIQAAYVMVRFTGSNSLNAAMDVKGVPGEQAVMTCNVETVVDKSSGPVKTQDCSGSAQTVSHELVGEQHFDKEIELNQDVLSDAQGSSDKNLSIDVTYN